MRKSCSFSCDHVWPNSAAAAEPRTPLTIRFPNIDAMVGAAGAGHDVQLQIGKLIRWRLAL
jgi:hypothetical protein